MTGEGDGEITVTGLEPGTGAILAQCPPGGGRFAGELDGTIS